MQDHRLARAITALPRAWPDRGAASVRGSNPSTSTRCGRRARGVPGSPAAPWASRPAIIARNTRGSRAARSSGCTPGGGTIPPATICAVTAVVNAVVRAIAVRPVAGS